jgi:hypothetical protein
MWIGEERLRIPAEEERIQFDDGEMEEPSWWTLQFYDGTSPPRRTLSAAYE